MKMLPLKKIFGAVVFASAIITSSVGYAANITSFFNPDYINGMQDRDRDRILDAQGNVKTTGNFAVGDVFEAVLQFDSVQWVDGNVIVNDTPIGNAPGVYAYSAVEIASITPGVLAGTIDVAFAAANGASMIDLYEGTPVPANIFDNGVSADTAISAVQSLTKIATFGIGEADDFWTATITTTVDALAPTLTSNIQPSGQFGLSILSDPGNLNLLDNGILGADGNLHDIIGKASVTNSAADGWLVATDTKVFFQTVPEPNTLALMGIAVLLGAFSQRGRKV